MLPIEKDQITIISESLAENENKAIEKLDKYKENKDTQSYEALLQTVEENKKAIKKYIPLLQDIFRYSNRKLNSIFETKLYGTVCNSYLVYPSTFFLKIAENESLKHTDWWDISYKETQI